MPIIFLAKRCENELNNVFPQQRIKFSNQTKRVFFRNWRAVVLHNIPAASTPRASNIKFLKTSADFCEKIAKIRYLKFFPFLPIFPTSNFINFFKHPNMKNIKVIFLTWLIIISFPMVFVYRHFLFNFHALSSKAFIYTCILLASWYFSRSFTYICGFRSY